MKFLFWISLFFVNVHAQETHAQEIGQVVSTTAEDSKSSPQAKVKVILAIKTTMDSFGLDWNTYGVKAHEGIEVRFAKSMLDWLTVSKISTVEEMFILNTENEAKDYTHVIHWNLNIRKLNTQSKVQQFQLSADYFIADKKNPELPFYKGNVPAELRTFPADLIKQIPDVLNKSLITLSVPHWQKIRQTVVAMQPSQEYFYVMIKNYKNINYVMNLIDYWKEQGKSANLDIKLDSFDNSQAKLKVWHRAPKPALAMKFINSNIPANNTELYPFKLVSEKQEKTEDKVDEIAVLSFLLN